MTEHRLAARSTAYGMGLLAVALAVAGCATTAEPPSAENEPPLYATSASNLTSLSESSNTIRDPQAYNIRVRPMGGRRNGRHSPILRRRSSLDPNYAQAYANRALIYRKTNKLTCARRRQQGAAIDASYVPAYLGRGIVYREQGRSKEALGDFNKAIALKPDNAEAYYNRGLLIRASASIQFAIDDFTTAIGVAGRKPTVCARALSYSRRRQQVGAPISTRRCSSIRWIYAPGPGRGLATSARDKDKAAAPLPRRSISTTNTSRRKPASPASAARSGSYPTF